MTVVTVYASDDGYITSNSTSYATARSTAATAYDAGGVVVGQQFATPDYHCLEGFLYFNLTALPATYVPLAASIFLKVGVDYTTTDFVIKAQQKTWQPSVTTGDWVAGASLSANTYFTGAAGAAADSWIELTLDSYGSGKAFESEFLLYSDRHKAGTTPSGNEHITFYPVATAGTVSDPYIVLEYVSTNKAGGYLQGALGPPVVWNRALTAVEVETVMALGMVIYDRALDHGTAVLRGDVRTRSGSIVPATHVRAGWWIHNLDANNERETKPRPLLISGHSVNLQSGENALTIGVDPMEEEIGVRMADLLAMPTPSTATAAEQAAVDPYMPDAAVEESASADASTSAEAGSYWSPTDTDPDYFKTHPWVDPNSVWKG